MFTGSVYNQVSADLWRGGRRNSKGSFLSVSATKQESTYGLLHMSLP